MPVTSSPQAIDRVPLVSPRPKEMQVLCLGLSRTGTLSMRSALNKLGYRAYHMVELSDPENRKDDHLNCWREAFIAKMYGRGKPYGKEEWDKMLGRYSAVTDAPCACFPDELIAAYPNAKVILSTRDPDKWLASVERSYFTLLSSRSWRWFRAFCYFDSEYFGTYIDLLRMPLRLWTKDDWESREKLKQAFLDHNAHIRETVPKENLLEWVPEDGFEPICRFLGKPIPKDGFPYVNKGTSIVQMHKIYTSMRAMEMFLFSPWSVISVAIAVFAWWSKKRE